MVIEQHQCSNSEHVTLIMGAGLVIPTWSRLPVSKTTFLFLTFNVILTSLGLEALSASDTEVRWLHWYHVASSFTANFSLLKSLLLLLEHDIMLLRREKEARGNY